MFYRGYFNHIFWSENIVEHYSTGYALDNKSKIMFKPTNNALIVNHI